ncbi:MAG: SpoIIE family protein phosphatase [Terriglobia bacterium]
MRTKLLEYGVAARTHPDESKSGDSYLVSPFRRGVLVAVLDGLGHGVEAAEAARIALDTLAEHASESPISLVRRCHANLPGTRGVVMSLASFDSAEDTVMWLGVGNVEGWLMRGAGKAAPNRESLLLRGGVVGGQLPELRASVLPVSRGDTLVFATDGVTIDFADGLHGETPQSSADLIMDAYRKGNDDALVLVARYR